MKKVITIWSFLSIFFVGHWGIASIPEQAASSEVLEAAPVEITKKTSNKIDQAIMDLASAEGELAGLDSNPEILPCEGRISSGFGMRTLRRRTRMHKGLDVAAPVGTPIMASGDGKVIFTGSKGGYGRVIIIEHNSQIQSLYAHASKILVKEGDVVTKGTIIAKTGNSGRSTGPHLHFEVLQNGVQVNPVNYIHTTDIQFANNDHDHDHNS